MNSFKRIFIVGATVIGLGSAAFAAQGDQAPAAGAERSGGWMHKHDEGKFKERMAKHQAKLHDKLKLTANQEPAWNTFTAAMTPPDHGNRPDRAEWAKLSAPERMEKMMARSQEHQQKMASRLAAMKTFYAVLTPEQQKIFNDNVGKGHRHGHHHGH